jgi:hypothetical protein
MKTILIAAVVLAVAAGAYFWIFGAEGQDKRAVYRSELYGYSFEYRTAPEGYLVQRIESPESYGKLLEGIVLILNEDYQSIERGEREGGEGPPTINVFLFENPEGYLPLEWLEAYPQFSNLGLQLSEPTQTVVAGKEAFTYEADGLYVSRNFIFSDDSNRIFFLSGSFMDRDSRLYGDFGDVVESFELNS